MQCFHKDHQNEECQIPFDDTSTQNMILTSKFDEADGIP